MSLEGSNVGHVAGAATAAVGERARIVHRTGDVSGGSVVRWEAGSPGRWLDSRVRLRSKRIWFCPDVTRIGVVVSWFVNVQSALLLYTCQTEEIGCIRAKLCRCVTVRGLPGRGRIGGRCLPVFRRISKFNQVSAVSGSGWACRFCCLLPWSNSRSMASAIAW